MTLSSSIDIVALVIILIVIYKYKLSSKRVAVFGLVFLGITAMVALIKIDRFAQETANIAWMLFVIAVIKWHINE